MSPEPPRDERAPGLAPADIALDDEPFRSTSLSEIFRARIPTQEAPVVVKKVRTSAKTGESVISHEQFEQAVAALERVPAHEGIVPLLGVFLVDGLPARVEPCYEGCLYGLLADPDGVDERTRTQLIIAVADAVRHLHAADVVHGRLSPKRVLLDANGRPALCGAAFGPIGGDLRYTAPEVLLGRTPGRASDVFALAGITAYIASGREPFAGELDPAKIAQATLSDEIPCDEVEHPRLRELLARAWATDPACRPSAEEFTNAARAALEGDDPLAQLTSPESPHRSAPHATPPVSPTSHATASPRSASRSSALRKHVDQLRAEQDALRAAVESVSAEVVGTSERQRSVTEVAAEARREVEATRAGLGALLREHEELRAAHDTLAATADKLCARIDSMDALAHSAASERKRLMEENAQSRELLARASRTNEAMAAICFKFLTRADDATPETFCSELSLFPELALVLLRTDMREFEPELGTITRLKLSGRFSERPFLTFPFAACAPQLTRLRTLDLSRNLLNDRCAALLGEPLAALQALELLSLADNELTADGVRALLPALRGRDTLQKLDVSGNPIGDAGAALLAEPLAAMGNLAFFGARHCELTDAGAESLARALAACGAMRVLWLFDNSIGDAGAAALAPAVAAMPQLESLSLQQNLIADAGAAELAGALPACAALRDLRVWGNVMTASGFAALVTALTRTRSIEFLSATQQPIGDAGASALAAAVDQLPRLREVYLSRCDIGPSGARALVDALRHAPQLTTLSIHSNDLSREDAAALPDALPNAEVRV